MVLTYHTTKFLYHHHTIDRNLNFTEENPCERKSRAGGGFENIEDTNEGTNEETNEKITEDYLYPEVLQHEQPTNIHQIETHQNLQVL